MSAMNANILTKEQREFGLYLEQDDHSVYLRGRGHLTPIAVFNAATVTIETIRHEAQQQVEWAKSGIRFERVVNV